MREKLIALAIVGLAGIMLISMGLSTFATLILMRRGLTQRAVDHVYGTSVMIETPNGKSAYFRWCDPEGYLMFANGFEENSTITVVKEPRCEGVR